MTSAHIINHTHWDREWFLTHEYTTAWIPALIDSLGELSERNPNYEFLFDGQTLVIEDLLNTKPDYRSAVHELIKSGNLSIGPVYSQPDWRMVSGELHIRNLLFGTADAEEFGGRADVAWLVDTFGHISQAPQMLALAGVDTAYVWRGVPEMTPLFKWVSPDGTQVSAIDLFGGYRNLYGISKTPDIAVDRLVAEVEKLRSHYGDVPIPLFDGYDLDTEPEDPVLIYGDLDVPDSVEIVASSPRTYADAVRPFMDDAPEIRGELLSGKYGSTFPGSLSSRAYLTVGQHDCERALHRVIEPLATLATAAGHTYDAETYERQSRILLQNGVHDCLCGVSIDPVHERMERSYREMIEWANAEQSTLAEVLLQGFSSGVYALSTSPMPATTTVRTTAGVAVVDTDGIGVSPVTMHGVDAVDEPVEDLSESVGGRTIRIEDDQLHLDGVGRLLRLIVRADAGDTYSSEPGEVLGELVPVGPARRIDRSEVDMTVAIPLGFSMDDSDLSIDATVRARFDGSSVLGLEIDVDSTGTGFRLDAEFATGVSSDSVSASMPFDVVERDHEQTDLLGYDVDPELAKILMGQRETGRTTDFPFHDFVAMSDGDHTAAVLAHGLRSYQSQATGEITVTLRRTAEWLALTGLTLRAGDAGPMMYVPGARCERQVTHRLAVAFLDGGVETSGLHEVSAAFQSPPVIASVGETNDSGASMWTVATAPLPSSALVAVDDGHAALRMHNPGSSAVDLGQAFRRSSLRGDDLGEVSRVGAKEILTTVIDLGLWPGVEGSAQVTVLTPIENRVGPSRSRPHANAMATLDARIGELEGQYADTLAAVGSADGDDRYRLTHQQYVVERELLELKLSRELNLRRGMTDDEVSIPDDRDPIISELGWELNDLRVKRRIYDYVVVSLDS